LTKKEKKIISELINDLLVSRLMQKNNKATLHHWQYVEAITIRSLHEMGIDMAAHKQALELIRLINKERA
jgi:hypothetical protein